MGYEGMSTNCFCTVISTTITVFPEIAQNSKYLHVTRPNNWQLYVAGSVQKTFISSIFILQLLKVMNMVHISPSNLLGIHVT